MPSSTESKALRIGDPVGLDSRFHGNDTFFIIPHLMRDPFGLDSRFHGNDTFFVILNQLPPVSSSTESKALRIGDPEITDWIPVFTGMTREGYGNDTFFVILNRKRSASDWGSIRTGFPFSRE